jgi:signal transduction histidine kinase
LTDESLGIKKYLFGKIGRRLTFIFLLIGIIAPAISIIYFYSLASSLLIQTQEAFREQLFILESAVVVIIFLIAINVGFLGSFISRSITKPIKELHNAAKEIEKGNFDVRVEIKTNDEIAKLGHAINMSAIALGKMKEERTQLDKAKSEFLSITSHELKTPITPLVVQLQMMKQQYFGKLTPKQKESLDIVLRNTERLSKMIEDFLEISRIEAARLKFNFKRADLRETIEETISLMAGSANEKNIKLLSNLETLPIFEFDPDRISQVLRNLIYNAIKFSNNSSEIEICAISKKNHILLSIRDHGIGISPQDQIRIFEPFYQSEASLTRKYEGTGLGLAICRGIVESQKSTFIGLISFTGVNGRVK